MNRRYPERPWVGIGVVLLRAENESLLRADEVLLVRRGRAPGLGQWSLPGGAQHVGETAEAAARRELAEETGLEAGPLSLLGHVDGIHRDRGGRVEFHYTILDFGGVCIGGHLRAADDAHEACFVPVARLADYGVTQAVTEMVARAVRLLGR